jgi:hypothetical protein
MAIADVPINKRSNLDFDFTRTPSSACTLLIFLNPAAAHRDFHLQK